MVVIIIALLVAGGAWWYYSANPSGYADSTKVELPAENSSSDKAATSTEVKANGQVNFGTVNDLPAGTSYPDVGK